MKCIYYPKSQNFLLGRERFLLYHHVVEEPRIKVNYPYKKGKINKNTKINFKLKNKNKFFFFRDSGHWPSQRRESGCPRWWGG